MSAREVELSGGAPWGFRMHGGADQNQPLRISRVNPGRKASLSGIREGDVITSINGKATKEMSNSDAHAMLRSVGPVLRLGLNEDREMSPRRRSIGKVTELKRPSQLISEINSGRATPQAPVYATIRPATSNNKLSSPIRSINSPLNSTTLVKSVSPEPLKFHPSNPFYSTLPNYTSASKLPIPNGKPSNTPINTPSKSADKNSKNDHDLKLSSFFSKRFDSGPTSIPNMSYEPHANNSYETSQKYDSNDKYSSFSDSQIKSPFRTNNDIRNNVNPFDSMKSNNLLRNSFTHSDDKINSTLSSTPKTINYSKSDSDFRLNEEVIQQSTISEKKISETEEIKTVKKITLNCSGGDQNHINGVMNDFEERKSKYNINSARIPQSSMNERVIPTKIENEDFYRSKGERNENGRQESVRTPSFQASREEYNVGEEQTSDGLSSRPPMKSPNTPTQATTPTNKPIWRPGAPTQAGGEAPSAESPSAPPPPPPPVWTPNTTSPQTPRKSFRPVHFEDTPPPRRKFGSSDQNGCTSGSESEGRLRTSQSAPATGLNTLGSSTSRLPRAQNPTVTLLQKAREGQIPRGPSNIPPERDPRLPRDRPSPPKGDPVHALRKEYASEGEGDRSDYERSQKMNDSKKKIEGIGPITKDGMPVALRSEVKDPSRWYKKMYDTIHKNKFDEDYVTIRYKNRRGEPQRPSSNRSQYAYFDPRSGYLSEPEGGLRLTSSTWSDAYDSDVATGPRRRTASVQEERRFDDMPYLANNKYSTLASARARQEVYKGQPGRIENYMPGKSSVIDKEAKQWWDEVMDIFDGQNGSVTPSQPQASPKEKKDLTSAILSKSNMARALKESGYESDSTLIFRRRENTEAPLSPAERHAAYRDLQAGGEPPLRGFRSPAPPRQDESEIEYIPISSTLTKIRVHKRSPQLHEVICYPVTNINKNYHEELKSGMDHPPIPPRRISSKNSHTLKLVTSSRHTSTSSLRQSFEQSNVEFLKDKISNKLNRQKTHVIIKREPSPHISLCRAMSTSAPPALNRNKNIIPLANAKQKSSASSCKKVGTSSFSSPRRTILPINYPYTERRPGTSSSSVIIEGGAGRKTPITNILDRVTSLDKLWSAQKRNERIDLSKIKPKSALKNVNTVPKSTPAKVSISINPKSVTTVTHKSRDMTRTSERIQKIKLSNAQAKSTPCLAKTDTKSVKHGSLQTMLNISKSTPQIPSLASKKQNQIKTAIVTTIKKKKSLESVIVKPRNSLCHDQINKKNKEINKHIKKVKNSDKKQEKHFLVKSDNKEEFGDVLDEMSNFGSNEDFDKHSKEIRQARNDIISDSFFQNLLLRKPFNSISVVNLEQRPLSIVQQKAKLFQALPETNLNTSNLINTYLIHRKPVTLSRFKMWDRQISPTRIQDARSISWPGKMDGKIRKFDSLTYCDSDFGSTSSLATIRSRSEPPINKLYFSQTSRPVSPTVVFHKKNLEAQSIKTSPSPTRFVFLQPSSTSPKPLRKFEKSLTSTKPTSPTKLFKSSLSVSPARESDISDINDKTQATMYFSQTSRPVSPKVVNKRSTSRSQSPLPVRSPSYRRIHSARTHSKLETISKVLRTRSADSSEKDINEKTVSTRTKSDSNIYTNDPEYDEYIRDIQNIKGRSERFRELNRYYSYLERVAELEKATSSRNMCYRKKDEEIIDFDRWKKIRTIERAEEELNNLYTKLKRAQNENDVLFYPRDVNDVRWNFNRERGLRTKEKSVEDLKEELQNKNCHEIVELEQSQCKDKYKPLWRGTSVAETAFSINKKNNEDKKNYINTIKPKTNQQLESLTDLRKKIGLGNRLWSSLSMDQVNALKNQLNAIYSKECESKSNKEDEKYIIEVKNTKSITNPGLHVRCSSLGAPISKIHEPELSKSESIGAISFPLSSEKELKNNVNKMQMTLSENEKKRISQSLSKEVLNRMSKYDTISKQEHKTPTSGDADHKKECKDIIDVEIENIQIEPKVQPNDKKTRHVIYPAQKIEISNQSSASETETGSSDISGATVIYKAPNKEVQKKVEYFESVKNDKNQSSTIYQAIDNSEGNLVSKHAHKTPNNSETKPEINQIFQSQSCANIKELFGETEKNKFLSLPLKPNLYSRSPSPQSEVYVSDRRTPDTLRFSSDETIWRSRSPSPDPERYWRAYVKLAREGEVRRLARRFDSPSAAGAVLRRYRSDPEIIRNDIKNKWTTTGRTLNEKSRALLPVARMPLRPSNRYMPHIDVISKLAALRRRNPPRSRSAEEALECRPGEVERIRRRFEAMSLLGQIYTSAPDVRELHNIASYLKGPWIAHRYPKPEDNNRSIQDSTILVRGRTTSSKRDKNHGHQDLVKINSILKNESLANQIFDPSAHRPASRYEPPREPPRPPPASWPYRVGPHITPSRHTVTFQETDSAPEPPRRVSHGSYSDSESPSRRYVESDVNIHYRCPVRHDPLPLVPERELARQQAEHMKRLYREQRRNKYLQELQDMQNRRHQDNFMPSQKTIVPLNRYDEAEKIIAKALYTFNGQTSRELSFRKGDIINVRRQIDSNWYEGEVHGKVGLFPYNYVELLKNDGVQTLKKPTVIEGRARAKFDFIAQTNLELPLKKGEVVVLTRRIDHNWWEGRNGNKTGIFPDSYVTILQEPSQSKPESQPIISTPKPAASPAAHGLINGMEARGMSAHRYTPQLNSPALSNAPPADLPLQGYITKSTSSLSASERGYGPPTGAGVDLNNSEPLYVDTNAEAIPYRAMYKYRPQNPDELELNEGDTVYVLEKCDDGWYVGSSQRTGRFGTFPGNYVERI